MGMISSMPQRQPTVDVRIIFNFGNGTREEVADWIIISHAKLCAISDIRQYIVGCAEGKVGSYKSMQIINMLIKRAGVDKECIVSCEMSAWYGMGKIFSESLSSFPVGEDNIHIKFFLKKSDD